MFLEKVGFQAKKKDKSGTNDFIFSYFRKIISRLDWDVCYPILENEIRKEFSSCLFGFILGIKLATATTPVILTISMEQMKLCVRMTHFKDNMVARIIIT